MRTRLNLTTVFGLLSIVTYLSLAVIAYAHYPSSFAPNANWLSDLGNRLLNPEGAVYYRTAGVLTGALLAAFFLTLGAAVRRQGGKRAVFMTVAETLGLVAALALVLTGAFSEDMGTPHSVASAVLYVSFGTAVWFVGWALLRGPGRSRAISYFAFCVAAATWTSAVLPHAYWLEWVAVFLLLLFVGVSVHVSERTAGT